MKKEIILIGDSHMRERASALRKLHHLKITYRRSNYPLGVGKLILYYLNKLSNFSSSVIVFNTGHWSLRFIDPISYIVHMWNLTKVIKLSKQHTSPKVIWKETTALPYNNYHGRWRKNSLIAAMNQWINCNMRSIGVQVVPAFDISFPMRSETQDGTHYSELPGVFFVNGETKRDMVSVGGTITSVLFQQICTDDI